MSVKLVLLGMLKRGPLHGYELKNRIEQQMGDWTAIAFGSIYFALKKLTEEGFVIQSGTEQQGNRPSRIVYEITDEGREEFQRLLVKTWKDDPRVFFSFDIGLYFLRELEPGQGMRLLQERIGETEKRLSYLRRHRDEEMSNPHIPPEARLIFSHSLHHLEAELAWLREAEELIGKYES